MSAADVARRGPGRLAAAGDTLTRTDPAGGDWIANGRKTFIAWMRRRDKSPSALSADEFVSALVDALPGAAVTWTPYDVVETSA